MFWYIFIDFLFTFSSPGSFWKSEEEGKKKKSTNVYSWASPSPNPIPSHLQTRQQTGPLCQPLTNCPLPAPEAGTSRSTVLQVFRDLGGLRSQGRQRLSAKGSTLGVFGAALHLGPCPGSSHAGSLATFPRESPKGSKCGYPRALGLLCCE